MWLTANGIKTQYQQIGQGEPIVMLHGWGCDWQIWSPVIGALSKNHQLILLDLPGFGHSENPPLNWTSADYVAWLKSVLTELQLKKVILLGHSFGGKISSLFASSHPTFLSKLILVDSSGLPAPLSTKQKLQEKILGLIPSAIKTAVPNSVKKKLLIITNSATDHFNSTSVQRQILKNSIREYIDQELQKISTPTLLIWGETDDATPISQAQTFHQLIANSRLEIVKQAGHFVFVDQPKIFLEKLTEFLS